MQLPLLTLVYSHCVCCGACACVVRNASPECPTHLQREEWKTLRSQRKGKQDLLDLQLQVETEVQAKKNIQTKLTKATKDLTDTEKCVAFFIIILCPHAALSPSCHRLGAMHSCPPPLALCVQLLTHLYCSPDPPATHSPMYSCKHCMDHEVTISPFLLPSPPLPPGNSKKQTQRGCSS